MFALLRIAPVPSINLKCDPERAVELRELFYQVEPGYHMNKKHWNTVTDLSTLTPNLITEWIDHSYNLVWAKLPKAKTRFVGR